MICDSYIFAVFFFTIFLIKLALFIKYPQMLTVFNAPSLCLKSWLGKLVLMPYSPTLRAHELVCKSDSLSAMAESFLSINSPSFRRKRCHNPKISLIV